MVGLMLTVAIGASAAPEKGQQAQQMPGDTAGPAVAGTTQAISGANDVRLITPEMNVRERLEVQRALKKRALAKRNQLIQAARAEEEQQERANRPDQPKMN